MTRKLWVLLTGLALLVVAVGGIWLNGQSRRTTSGDLLDQESFLAVLRDTGVSVTKTAGTNAYAPFHVPRDAEVGIWTEQGFLDAIFFPSHVDGKMTVEQLGEYSWQIHGLPKPAGWSSNHAWYFLAHRNVVIATDSPDLYATLNQGLKK